MKTGGMKPSCEEMIQWLLAHDGYISMSREQLFNDPTIAVVSSSCEMSLEQVVNLVETLRAQKLARK